MREKSLSTTLQAATTLGAMASEIFVLATCLNWYIYIYMYIYDNNLLSALYWNNTVLSIDIYEVKEERCCQYSFK